MNTTSEQVTQLLKADNYEAAYAVFEKLTKTEIDLVSRELFGQGYYNETRKKMLEMVKRFLPRMTATAVEGRRIRNEIQDARKKLDLATINRECHIKGLMGAPIRDGLSDQEFKNPHIGTCSSAGRMASRSRRSPNPLQPNRSEVPVTTMTPPMSDRVRKAMQLADAHRILDGDNMICTDHMLLGLIGAGGIAHDILVGLGAYEGKIKAIIAKSKADFVSAINSPGDQPTMTPIKYTLNADKLRDGNGHLVRLGEAKLTKLNEAWDNFRTAQADFMCINGHTRTRWQRVRDTGIELVRVQTLLNVWVIHPDNARPGWAEDDERIIERFNSVSDVETHLKTMSQAQLVAMLTEVAANLSFDASGNYGPEDSTAGNSGADYIEQITNMFHRNEIEI
jgi:hypothetical protein